MDTNTRFVLLALVLMNALLFASCQQKEQLPNIIFFLSDDQDVYDYGCYGNDKVHTPAIDRLAREGMMFHNAFTGQAICAPSRSQLYTGNYPLKNGCFLNHVRTKPDQLSVTHYLKNAGYDVILAGKSHVGPSKVYHWNKEWKPEKQKGFPRPHLPFDSIQHYFEHASKPFCMFITSEYPHGPYFKPDAPDTSELVFYPFDDHKKNNDYHVRRKAGYYLNIQEENSQLEKVLMWVDEFLDENTLFIYSADHGMSGKFTVYDRGLHVPFVVRWPGVVQENTESDALIHYTDVLPTYLDILGIEIPEEIDGKSFLSLLKGGNEEIHSYVFGVQTNQNIQQCKVFPSRSVRSKKYKYIRNFNSTEVLENNLGDKEAVNYFIKTGSEKFGNTPFEELYDIQNDPYEQVNLAGDPEYAEIRKELVDALYSWMNEQGDFLSEEGYMPLIKPSKWALDKNSVHRKIPEKWQNTLKDEDYLILEY